MAPLRVLLVHPDPAAAAVLERAVAEAAACLSREADVRTTATTEDARAALGAGSGVDLVVAPAGPVASRLTLALSQPEAFLPVIAVAETVAEGIEAVLDGGAADFVSGTPPETGDLVSAMLVAENRRGAVAAFREQRAALSATLAAAGAAVATLDPGGIVRSFAAAPALRDALPAALTGRPLASAAGDAAGPALAAAACGEAVRFAQALRTDAGPRTLRWAVAPLGDGLGAVAVDATQASLAERRSDLFARFLDGVARETPVVIFATDALGRFVYLRGHGFENATALIGQTVEDAFRDAPQVVANLHRALDGETFSDHVRLPDGRRFRVAYAPLEATPGDLPGMVGVATDTTQTDGLRREVGLLEALVAQTGALAASTGPTGDPHVVSPALADLLGADADGIRARGGIATLYTDPGVAARIAASVRSGTPWAGPLALRAADGTSVSVVARARPVLDADGQRIGAVIVFERADDV